MRQPPVPVFPSVDGQRERRCHFWLADGEVRWAPDRDDGRLVELDRTGRASSNLEKFRRYDALITAGGMSHPRYKALEEPPIVVFVVEDDDKAQQFVRAADQVVIGRLGKWGTPESSWPPMGGDPSSSCQS